MRMYLVGLSILALVLIVWIGWTLYVLYGIEQTPYRVIEKQARFEVRAYEPHIVAYVEVEGGYNEALREGFRLLAGYIFGGNTSQTSIAMTSPVTENASEKIAMTVPVTEEARGTLRRITFTMPASYSLDTLPTPNDPRVRFEEVPAKTYAAQRFTWYATTARVERNKQALLDALREDGAYTPQGAPLYAGYNDPWSFPLLMRNEVLVEVVRP